MIRRGTFFDEACTGKKVNRILFVVWINLLIVFVVGVGDMWISADLQKKSRACGKGRRRTPKSWTSLLGVFPQGSLWIRWDENEPFGDENRLSAYLARMEGYPPDMGVRYFATRRGFPQFAVFIHRYPQVIHRKGRWHKEVTSKETPISSRALGEL